MKQIPSVQSLRNILILRGEGSLGDAIISSCCYRGIKEANPDIKITVACFGSGYEFLSHNPYIDEIIRLPIRTLIRPHQRWPSLIGAGLKLRQRHFDLVLDSSAKHFYNWRLFKWLVGGSRVLDDLTSPVRPFGARDKHGAEHECAILQLLGVPHPTSDYDLPVPAAVQQSIKQRLEQNNITHYILLNPTGSTEKRRFHADTLWQLCNRLRSLGLPILVPSAPAYYAHWSNVFKEEPAVWVMQTSSVFDLFELVRKADWIITPDTSVVHIASGFKKPTLVFYNTLSVYNAPNNTKALIIETDPQDVNLFNWEELSSKIQQMKDTLDSKLLA
ncbi:MAG: glycosyltransferase family 9 protein [Elusimicrobiaceae bacterium]|nr:glycosyltransferase family 9 protein [Elusimicrobiaceae bacterium]